MIPKDLKASCSHSQTPWKISDDASQTVEVRTNQFTTTLLQTPDLEATLKAQASLQNERSDRIHLETTQKVNIEGLPQDIEAHYYKQLLQAKRENLVQKQILYLEKLSDHYLKKKNWMQAAKLLNCALAILEKNLDDPSYQTYLYLRVERIEALFLESKGIMIPSQHKVSIQEIIAFLTNSYRKLLGTILLDSQELLGNPFTQWACIGMGSMARSEMCPYSDLEFAFLINYKTKETLDYFRTLSQFLELRIINLGETKFPVFAQLFGEDSIETSPTPGGFSMDIGGNTPLGKPGFYELIDTPQALAQYQCVHWMEADIIVTNALSTTCYLAGDQNLVYTYNKAKGEALNKTDGFLSFTGIPFRNKLALKLLEGNLQEYQLDLSKKKQETSAFGIKKELYRPLQSLLSTLTLYCGLELQSTFGMIQQLLHKRILCSEGAKNLTKALNQILSLRFEAHTFYQSEEEFLLHIEQGVSQNPHFLYLDEERLKTLHDIYMVLIPLQRCGEAFFKTKKIQIFANATLYDESPAQQGDDFSESFQYVKAQIAYQNAVSLNPNDIDAQLNLGEMEEQIGQSKEALTRKLKALTLAREKYGEHHSEVARSYNSIGGVYGNLGEYNQALICYKKALEIWFLVLGENTSEVAGIYNNMGIIYCDLGKYLKALKFYKKALTIQLRLPEENNREVAQGFNNMGTIYAILSDFTQAFTIYQKALQINLQIMDEDHPYMTQSYTNIGNVCANLEQYEEALEYYQKTLEIELRFLGENHPQVALSYNNIGNVYSNLKAYDLALNFYTKALEIQSKMLDKNHPDLALSYHNISVTCCKLEKYDQALKYFHKELLISILVLGENHLDIADIYHSLATLYDNLGENDPAIEFSQKALRILLLDYEKDDPLTEQVMKDLIKYAQKASSPEGKVLEEILDLCIETFGEQHPLVQEIAQFSKK